MTLEVIHMDDDTVNNGTGIPQAQLVAPVPIEEESPMAKAMRDELKKMIEQPLNPSVAQQISAFARQAGEILITTKQDPNNNRMPTQMNFGGPMMYGSSSNITVGGVLAPSSPAETYGVAVIRELIKAVSVFQNKKTSGADIEYLTNALAKAKTEKLGDEIIQSLESTLKSYLASTKEESNGQKTTP